ncbi:MAG: hypothetical protein FWF78_00520 [Defluviitaleaceae bacterium]|nr:hypothetical protein [Defluviitaleaceae bacterium]
MDKQKKHIGIRLNPSDAALHYKYHHIAKYEGRTGNGHILYLLRKDIERFEKEHGEITLPSEL